MAFLHNNSFHLNIRKISKFHHFKTNVLNVTYRYTMCFIIQELHTKRLFSVLNSNHVNARPLVVTFKHKHDAKVFMNNIVLDNTYNRQSSSPHTSKCSKPGNKTMLEWFIKSGLMLLPTDVNMEVKQTPFSYIKNRCRLNCLDILLVSDSSFTYEIIENTEPADMAEFIYHLNCMFYDDDASS